MWLYNLKQYNQGKPAEKVTPEQRHDCSPCRYVYTFFNMSPLQEKKTKQNMKALLAQLCLTLCDPIDCSPPGSSVHGIIQARILE